MNGTNKICPMKKRNIFLFAIILIVAIVVALIVKNVKHDENIIKVGYKLNSGYQIYFVAKDLGIYEKHELKVEGVSFTSTAQMMQALVSGQIDATAAGSIEVIAETELNSPNSIRVFNTLVFNKANPFFSIIIPINSKINSIKDLKGKSIGVLPGTTSVTFLKSCVSNFFSPDSMRIEQLELRIQLQALSLGQVDALYTVDPIVSLAINKNIGKILIKGPENTYIMNPMATGGSIVSVKFFNEKRNAALKFINAMDETIDIMRTDELNTRKIVAKNTNLDQNIAATISLIDYWKLGETDFSHVQKYLDFLYSQKILSKPINANELYLKR